MTTRTKKIIVNCTGSVTFLLAHFSSNWMHDFISPLVWEALFSYSLVAIFSNRLRSAKITPIVRRFSFTTLAISMLLWLASCLFYVQIPYSSRHAFSFGGGIIGWCSGVDFEGKTFTFRHGVYWSGLLLESGGISSTGWGKGKYSYRESAGTWPVPAGFLLPTIILCLARKRTVSPGHCQKCDYNLRGNVSGTCPECGTRIPEDTSSEVPTIPPNPRKSA